MGFNSGFKELIWSKCGMVLVRRGEKIVLLRPPQSPSEEFCNRNRASEVKVWQLSARSWRWLATICTLLEMAGNYLHAPGDGWNRSRERRIKKIIKYNLIKRTE